MANRFASPCNLAGKEVARNEFRVPSSVLVAPIVIAACSGSRMAEEAASESASSAAKRCAGWKRST
jgi:hypothetical protein